MKIYAFHLLNDFSGSPKVLMQLSKAWVTNGLEVHLTSSFSRKGFLSDIPGVKYHNAWYRFASNPMLRLLYYTFSQILIFFRFVYILKSSDLVYVNTVLPFGAALAGKFKNCRVIYHVHETTVNPPVLKIFLFGILKCTCSDAIFVSKYLAEKEVLSGVKSHVMYNAIEPEFMKKGMAQVTKEHIEGNVLMVCSLKVYKGVMEFVDLAKLNPHFHFQMVINSTMEEIRLFFAKTDLPFNLKLVDTQTDLTAFYTWADIILNLSRPDAWIETFGLTIIEGMAYSLPAIVPPVGGITELVEEGVNGFQVDSRDMNVLNATLNKILTDPKLYEELAKKSILKLNEFTEDILIKKNMELISLKY